MPKQLRGFFLRRAPTMLALALIAALAAAAPADDAAPGAPTLRYLGHSCFLITAPGGERVLIDPFAGGEWPGLSFPVTHAERVLVTHPHWDHQAWRAVRGDPKVTDAPGVVKGKGYVVTGIAGRHAGIGGADIGYRNIIYVIETGGVRICHLGDNGPVTGATREAIGPVDVLLLPVDAELRVLTYEQATDWMSALRPRLVIPMHYRLPGLSLEHITGIGTIEEWLQLQQGVERIAGDTLRLEPESLPPPGARHVRVLTLAGQQAPPPPVTGSAEAREAKRRGESAAAEGDVATALAELSRAADLMPDDADLLQKLGFLHLGEGRPDRALTFLTRAAAAAGEKDPKIASLARLGAGMALDLLGRREEALAEYRAVVALGLNDEHQADQARRHMESPYRED